MHVKIIQSPHQTWYNHRIGEEYEVIDTELKDDPDGPYIITKGGGIFCADYVVINRYPTLKENYQCM